MKNLVYIFILVLGSSSFAQQDPLYAQFWNTQQRFNPAYTGLKAQHEAHAMARWQWVQVNGAPETQLVTYGTKLNKINSGVGLVYEHEYIGLTEVNLLKLNYAYHLQFSDEHLLSFGLAAGANTFSYTEAWIPPTSEPDGSIPDDGLNIGFTSDLGIFYSFKRFDAGLSVTQLVDSRNTPTYSEARHYYFYAGYLFGKDDGFQVKPQLFYRTTNGFQAFDVNALFTYQAKYLLGLSYRNRNSFCFSGGYTLKERFNLTYTYELTTSKLNNGVSGGSHELHLGFRLKNSK
jgi:type IX secretion system PorP/SprF family membrane protein